MIENRVTKLLNIKYPLICGAMYPCSNPELVAAVSREGGMGVIQPLSLIYVHRYDFREGVKKIIELSGGKSFGMNVIVEKSSQVYESRMRSWVDIALEMGCKFFVTALGDPSWVVQKVHAQGGMVFHDVTEKKFALKGLDAGADGLICVNARAGGHAGRKSPHDLYQELKDLNVPLVCAGGVSDQASYREALEIGYEGVQMGTRFIASLECTAHADYKSAILKAKKEDIVLTERVTGVPLAVINTPYLQKVGTRTSFIGRFFLKNARTKHLARLYYSALSFIRLKRSLFKEFSTKDFYQAGQSVERVSEVLSVESIFKNIV